jgi:hypothetical protein
VGGRGALGGIAPRLAGAGCAGNGRLKALTPGGTAPLCEICGDRVTWQLAHLAPSVAADHYGMGHLP